MNEKEIHKIIDLYFEAQLSLSEEEELFKSLLAFKGKDRKVDEALAVMLMARLPMESSSSGLRPQPRRFSGLRPVIAVAASITLLFAIGVTSFWHYSNRQAADEAGGIMAYVEGVKVSDHSEIMKIVDDQLNDIGISSELFAQTIAEDLDDIVDAFNEEGI